MLRPAPCLSYQSKVSGALYLILTDPAHNQSTSSFSRRFVSMDDLGRAPRKPPATRPQQRIWAPLAELHLPPVQSLEADGNHLCAARTAPAYPPMAAGAVHDRCSCLKDLGGPIKAPAGSVSDPVLAGSGVREHLHSSLPAHVQDLAAFDTRTLLPGVKRDQAALPTFPAAATDTSVPLAAQQPHTQGWDHRKGACTASGCKVLLQSVKVLLPAGAAVPEATLARD